MTTIDKIEEFKDRFFDEVNSYYDRNGFRAEFVFISYEIICNYVASSAFKDFMPNFYELSSFQTLKTNSKLILFGYAIKIVTNDENIIQAASSRI